MNKLIESLTDYLIERRDKSRHIQIQPNSDRNLQGFTRVLNTLRQNLIMVTTKDDGIYIRLAGDEKLGFAFSETFTKVYSFEKN